MLISISCTPPASLKTLGTAPSGSYVYGQGFVLSIDEAQGLLRNPENKRVVYPYLIGDAFNSRPDQSCDRYVINFFDWPLSRQGAPKGYSGRCATDFPDCLEIVRDRVKPERDKVNEKRVRETWWQYGRRAVDLYEVIGGKQRVLFHPFTSKYMCFGFTSSRLIFAQPHIVIALEDGASFAVLQSGVHGSWVDERCSRMKTDIRYVASDVFDTFARPHPSGTALGALNDTGEEYHSYRKSVTLARQVGLTACYNLFHDPDETAADIQTAP